MDGFFCSVAFPADVNGFRQFAEACEALNMDRSEVLFDAINLAVEGVIATAAAVAGTGG